MHRLGHFSTIFISKLVSASGADTVYQPSRADKLSVLHLFEELLCIFSSCASLLTKNNPLVTVGIFKCTLNFKC